MSLVASKANRGSVGANRTKRVRRVTLVPVARWEGSGTGGGRIPDRPARAAGRGGVRGVVSRFRRPGRPRLSGPEGKCTPR